MSPARDQSARVVDRGEAKPLRIVAASSS